MADVVWHDDALKRAVAEASRPAVAERTAQICASANSIGGGFRTGFYHRDHKSPAVGGTAASYTSDVEEHAGLPVGIVQTGNYAAMVDNARNNTLLKARG